MSVEEISQQKTNHRYYVDSIIRVVDVAYPIMQVQDLDEQEKFLLAFGLRTSFKSDAALYMRGTGVEHTIYCAYKGMQKKFIGTAFRAESMNDLKKIALHEGVSVLKCKEPFGGYAR